MNVNGDDIVIITRFLGTTSTSSSISMTLKSIIKQLDMIFDKRYSSDDNNSYEKMKSVLYNQLESIGIG